MTTAETVADRIEAELAPLHEAASRAMWEINTLASDENEARVIETARSGATGSTRRRLALLRPAFLANQVQLSAMLERESGGLVDRPAADALLRERIFHPGQSVRWDRLLERATGEPLTAKYFGRDLEAGS